MFVCQLCERRQPARTPSACVVLELRPRSYGFRKEVNRHRRTTWTRDGRKKRKTIVQHDYGGFGTEIVKELRICPDCAESWSQSHPQREAAG